MNSPSFLKAKVEDQVTRVASGRTCLLVLGMHRSGTSALTRVLSIAGAKLPASLMGAGKGNEAGHWESDTLVQYHDQLLDELGSTWQDWRALEVGHLLVKRRRDIKAEIGDLLAAEFGDARLFVLKDPRICRFAPIFLDALEDAGIGPRIVHIVRNPLEVAESLECRDGLLRTDAALQWLRHVLDSEAATRSRPRVIVSYAALLTDWRATFDGITEALRVAWPYSADDIAGQVTQFLDQAHRHHTHTTEDVVLDAAIRDWVGETYSAMLMLEQRPGSKAAMTTLDTVRREFDHAAPILHRLQADARSAADSHLNQLKTEIGQAHTESERLSATLAEREREGSSLKASLGEAEAQAAQLTAALAERDKQITELSTTVEQQNDRAQQLAAALAERQREEANLSAALQRAESKAAALAATLSEREKQLADLGTTADQANTKSAELASELAKRDKQVTELNSTVEQANAKVQQLAATLTERDSQIAHLSRTADQANATAELVAAKLTEVENIAAEMTAAVAQRVEEASNLSALLAQRDAATAALKATLAETKCVHQETVEHLRTANETISAMSSTLSWRLTRPLRFGRRQQLNLADVGATFVTAAKLGGGIIPTAFKAARTLKIEGARGLRQRFRNVDQHRRGGSLAANHADQPNDDQTNELTSDFPIAEIKRRILENQRPLGIRTRGWAKAAPKAVLKAEQAIQLIESISPPGCSRMVLSVTHDNYREVVGGVQLCVQLEEKEHSDDGDLYLNIHPYSPLSVLSRETDPDGHLLTLIANGRLIGTVNTKALRAVLAITVSRIGHADCVIHSLLGHSTELLRTVLLSARISKGVFWLHDYFSVCPSYNLLRNEITFCNAPDCESPACTICVFGDERPSHLKSIRELFESFQFDIVSPSRHALELWQHSSGLPYRKATVVPHCHLAPGDTTPQTPRRHQDEPIRVAFLGHPSPHKGWPVFAQLASELRRDGNYEFHHLGQGDTRQPGIQYTPVRTSASSRDAMKQAIIRNHIEVVLLWSIWPETFCFTLHEALAAGAFVVANYASGNVAAMLKDHDDGIVVEDERRLADLFSGGELRRLVLRRRSLGRRTYELEYASCTRNLLNSLQTS